MFAAIANTGDGDDVSDDRDGDLPDELVPDPIV
jgi:hypothetical protein